MKSKANLIKVLQNEIEEKNKTIKKQEQLIEVLNVQGEFEGKKSSSNEKNINKFKIEEV